MESETASVPREDIDIATKPYFVVVVVGMSESGNGRCGNYFSLSLVMCCYHKDRMTRSLRMRDVFTDFAM